MVLTFEISDSVIGLFEQELSYKGFNPDDFNVEGLIRRWFEQQLNGLTGLQGGVDVHIYLEGLEDQDELFEYLVG